MAQAALPEVRLTSSTVTEEARSASGLAESLIGTWRIDLRPTPESDPFYAEMHITGVEGKSIAGRFFDSPMEEGRINMDWGKIRFSFVTEDGSGPYYTSGVLDGDRMQGTTHSAGRDFLSVWTGERSGPDGEVQAFADLLQKYVDAQAFEGAVLVGKGKEIIYKDAFGFANREWEIPLTTSTKFKIASITKQFTALLIMQLIEEEKVSLEGFVSDYLPYFREDTGKRIKILHLLQHTSGLPEEVTEFDQIDDALAVLDQTEERVKLFADGDPAFEPGSQFNYCNTDFSVLGAIIEQLRGKPFAAVLQERVLNPLGMKNSGVLRPESVIEGLASGYVRTENGWNARIDFGHFAQAAAGMYSTVEDLHLWNAALLNHTLLSETFTKLMFTPRDDVGNIGNYVALGSWVYQRPLPPDNEKRPWIAERRGYISPFTALNVLALEDGYSVILLSNADPADIHQLPYAAGLPLDLLSLLYGQPVLK